MKVGVKRIEATLHDLERTTSWANEPATTTKRSFSFRISTGASEYTVNTDTPEQELPPTDNELFPQDTSVQSMYAQDSGCKAPSLPKLKTPSFTSHRNGANPALAMNLLQEIQQSVTDWQKELQKIIQQIQEIYLEGPIVNGWLESHDKQAESDKTAPLRHAEVDHLMDYVEEICANQANMSCQSPRAGYRLCGLDANGKVWSRPCPQDQVASVSMAIARYQKLRQLLGRKQYLEIRLTQLAETLTILHGHIQQA
ncbi:hypothetical protein [Iningainema tapete]|uniref:Uncharacterized protein n=1 Tax=Iningainema tapete BLCC-T55 TaxID=2748662 RepID=A0A8J7C4I7_9CYAN|nr:hypothetical protein [Iningainema tapete]MBD2771539.1 hypothetical protein [Iningainema tapete BLCC-T55]